MCFRNYGKLARGGAAKKAISVAGLGLTEAARKTVDSTTGFRLTEAAHKTVDSLSKSALS